MREYVDIFVIKPGLLSSFQDQGRPGYESYGVPSGGALDRSAAIAANRLVGNPPEEPVLEVTLSGPVLQFRQEAHIAICGAHLDASLDGQRLPHARRCKIKPGQTLRFGKRRAGFRAYLAIAGQWQVDRWLGSASALPALAGHILPSNILKAGRQWRVLKAPESEPFSMPNLPSGTGGPVGLHPGPEFNWFSGQWKKHLTGLPHRIGPQTNRMGLHLPMPGAPKVPKANLISSAIVPGCIQVMPSGSAHLLLADAQTTGGYPRPAVVRSADLDRLGQLMPGEYVRFRWVDHR